MLKSNSFEYDCDFKDFVNGVHTFQDNLVMVHDLFKTRLRIKIGYIFEPQCLCKFYHRIEALLNI